MNTILNKINSEILEYSEKGLISTEDISNGFDTFSSLYNRIFMLEFALEKCRELNDLDRQNIEIVTT